MKYTKITSLILFISLVIFVSGINSTFDNKVEYVTDFIQDQQQPEEVQDVYINFVGDIMLGRVVNRKINSQSDPVFPLHNVRDFFNKDDLTIANLESPFGETGMYNEPGIVFNADPKDASRLRLGGVDIVSLANNHTLDQGVAGLRFTQKVLDENKILNVGTGEDCHQGKVINIKNTKIGILSYSYTAYNSGGHAPHPLVCDWEDFTKVLQDLVKIKEVSDVVIVLMHTGIENTENPTEKDRNKFRALVDNGANIVIGHHPHVLQPIEEYNGGLIAYSLGNFVFDQIEPDQKVSQILNVTLNKNGYKSYKTTPVKIENLCCPNIITN